MQIIVRYWISIPPLDSQAGSEGWVDHSSHPPSRLGLHNALLAAEDRLAILRNRYDEEPHGCNIFIESPGRRVMLSVQEANELLAMLEDGGVAWETLAALMEVGNEEPAIHIGLKPGEGSSHAREMAEYEKLSHEERRKIDYDA